MQLALLRRLPPISNLVCCLKWKPLARASCKLPHHQPTTPVSYIYIFSIYSNIILQTERQLSVPFKSDWKEKPVVHLYPHNFVLIVNIYIIHFIFTVLKFIKTNTTLRKTPNSSSLIIIPMDLKFHQSLYIYIYSVSVT